MTLGAEDFACSAQPIIRKTYRGRVSAQCMLRSCPPLLEANTSLQYRLWTAGYNDTRWLGKATLRETGQTGNPVCEVEPGRCMLTQCTAAAPFACGQGATSSPGSAHCMGRVMCRMAALEVSICSTVYAYRSGSWENRLWAKF